MTYQHRSVPGVPLPNRFSVGERVVVVRHPLAGFITPHPHCAPGDAGTVMMVHPSRSFPTAEVRLDRTGRQVTVFEDELAPEPSTP